MEDSFSCEGNERHMRDIYRVGFQPPRHARVDFEVLPKRATGFQSNVPEAPGSPPPDALSALSPVIKRTSWLKLKGEGGAQDKCNKPKWRFFFCPCLYRFPEPPLML